MARIAVSIPEHLFTCPAYRALSAVERYLLIELLALASRIGTAEPIGCSARTVANMCGIGKSYAAEVLAALREKGFIVQVEPHRGRRGCASKWRITCLPFLGEEPTCDYQRIFLRAQHKKIVDQARGQMFFTPELNAIWRQNKTANCDENEDAEASAPADTFELQVSAPVDMSAMLT
jgi:hypothetical protein